MRSLLATLALALATPTTAHAFCGMYVGGAGAKLYNKASQVAISRVGDRTTISMRNDYKGKAKDFALVVPVPVVLAEKDVRTVSPTLFDRLDSFSAPRLVEYFERDPCAQPDLGALHARRGMGAMNRSMAPQASGGMKRDYGVKVEAEFQVDEYDIQILSAKESNGLEAWLKDNGYKMPDRAAPILAPYVKRQMKFFAAKVDGEKILKDKDGNAVLTPLQFAFAAPTFELPIRLGMANGRGLQDLIIYALTERSKVSVTNYPTVNVPTNIELGDKVPGRKKGESDTDAFGRYFLKLFNTAQDEAGGAAVLTEYAWSTSSCDPCPSPPLRPHELQKLGLPSGRGVVTRLHARYSPKLFKDDLVLGLAPHQTNFQGRYILRHPWKGPITCKNPQRGIWGDGKPRPMVGPMTRPVRNPIGRPGNPFGPGIGIGPSKQPAPRVRVIARVAGVENGSKQVVQRVLVRRTSRFRSCAARARMKGSAARGDLRVRFEISARGRVENIAVKSDTVKNANVIRCVVAQLRRMRFPRPKDPAQPTVVTAVLRLR